MYRNEFALLKAKFMMKIRENDNQVKKLADMTIKNKELNNREKPFKEQIELLESLNKSYSQQISELHSNKEMLQKQLRENSKLNRLISYDAEPEFQQMINSDLKKIRFNNLERQKILEICENLIHKLDNEAYNYDMKNKNGGSSGNKNDTMDNENYEEFTNLIEDFVKNFPLADENIKNLLEDIVRTHPVHITSFLKFVNDEASSSPMTMGYVSSGGIQQQDSSNNINPKNFNDKVFKETAQKVNFR